MREQRRSCSWDGASEAGLAEEEREAAGDAARAAREMGRDEGRHESGARLEAAQAELREQAKALRERQEEAAAVQSLAGHAWQVTCPRLPSAFVWPVMLSSLATKPQTSWFQPQETVLWQGKIGNLTLGQQ